MDYDYKLLMEKAKKASKKSYSPFSKFAVGAAVLAKGGKIYTGCNVENSSFGMTICAERCAIFKAVSEGVREILAVAIFSPNEDDCYPCGACRQVMYEFQTMMCRLTGMDIANATVYDGATACAEAILMAVRIAKKNKVLVSEKLNPEYLKVIKTYTWAGGIEVEYFRDFPENTADYAAVLIQTPDYYGEIAEVSAVDCLLIVCCDVSTLSILKPPAEYGADIVAADIQTLGMPMSFGGPHAGILACKEKYMRQLPGRLAGRTVDKDGNQAFTLTIQTREQHIKREKATSNICSNQALMGLWAALYLSLLGEKGFRQAGYLSAKNAHVLSDKLAHKGIKTLTKNFFNEFVIEVTDSDKFLANLKSRNILGGIKLDGKKILVAATEMNTDEEIDLYVKSLP